MRLKIHKKITYSFVAIVLFFCLSFIIFNVLTLKHIKNKEETLKNEIDNIQIVSYTQQSLDSDLQTLMDLLKSNHTDSFKGFLYERISFIYKCMGDDLNYYSYLGKALYCLEKSGNYQTLVNLYADLIEYQYLPNCNYELAKLIMDKIEIIEEREGIQDPNIRIYVYRLKGELAYYDKNYEEALKLYEKSKIEALHSSPYLTDFYIPSIEIQIERAKLGLAKNNKSIYEEIKPTLDFYNNPENFNPNFFSEVITKAFVIPYFQTSCCYYAYKNESEKLAESLDFLILKCEEQSVINMAINTMETLLDEYTLNEQDSVMIQNKLRHIFSNTIIDKSINFTTLCDTQINSNYHELELIEMNFRNNIRIIIIVVIFLLFLVFLILFISEIRYISYSDELTQVYNRRYLFKKLQYNKAKKINYSAIMIDIDDFKKINDKYGHDQGDKVLQKIGEILNFRCSSKYLEAFRYGGEEFTILVYDNEILSPETIAEGIRHETEIQKWSFDETITISLGVANYKDIDGSVSVMKQADLNLYYAKNHGKNQVSNHNN